MKKFFVAIGTAALLSGFAADEGKQISEVYVVKPGDTVWSISEEYLPKNTAGRKYILQFQDEILEANPAVKANGCNLHPGDKLIINYQVK